MKKSILLIAILVIVVFGLSIVRIYISNKIATSGIGAWASAESRSMIIKCKICLLAEKLYIETSSLTNIAAEAAKDGYVEPNRILY